MFSGTLFSGWWFSGSKGGRRALRWCFWPQLVHYWKCLGFLSGHSSAVPRSSLQITSHCINKVYYIHHNMGYEQVSLAENQVSWRLICSHPDSELTAFSCLNYNWMLRWAPQDHKRLGYHEEGLEVEFCRLKRGRNAGFLHWLDSYFFKREDAWRTWVPQIALSFFSSCLFYLFIFFFCPLVLEFWCRSLSTRCDINIKWW